MGDAIDSLRTDADLLEELKKASATKPTQEELQQQRVSFIFGSLKSDSNVTREHIRQVLEEQEGRARGK